MPKWAKIVENKVFLILALSSNLRIVNKSPYIHFEFV